jgi:hypothetical protein
VYCITSILDRISMVSYNMDKPLLVHELINEMRSSGLWPIWSAAGRTKSLHDQLDALSTLDVPIISANDQKWWMHGFSPTAPLDSRSVMRLADRLKDLCEGLCLNCLKSRGSDGCTWWNHMGHPEPWGPYEAERSQAFGREGRDSRPSPSVPSRSPGTSVYDVGGGWDFGGI